MINGILKKNVNQFEKLVYIYKESVIKCGAHLTTLLWEKGILIENKILSFFHRDRYPYFKAEDDRWKNSVRHNLSMNPHFRKGNKAKHGSGHLWVLADYDTEKGDIHPTDEIIKNMVPTVISLDKSPASGSQQSSSRSRKSREDDESARAVLSIMVQSESQILNEADKENNATMKKVC